MKEHAKVWKGNLTESNIIHCFKLPYQSDNKYHWNETENNSCTNCCALSSSMLTIFVGVFLHIFAFILFHLLCARRHKSVYFIIIIWRVKKSYLPNAMAYYHWQNQLRWMLADLSYEISFCCFSTFFKCSTITYSIHRNPFLTQISITSSSSSF